MAISAEVRRALALLCAAPQHWAHCKATDLDGVELADYCMALLVTKDAVSEGLLFVDAGTLQTYCSGLIRLFAVVPRCTSLEPSGIGPQGVQDLEPCTQALQLAQLLTALNRSAVALLARKSEHAPVVKSVLMDFGVRLLRMQTLHLNSQRDHAAATAVRSYLASVLAEAGAPGPFSEAKCLEVMAMSCVSKTKDELSIIQGLADLAAQQPEPLRPPAQLLATELGTALRDSSALEHKAVLIMAASEAAAALMAVTDQGASSSRQDLQIQIQASHSGLLGATRSLQHLDADTPRWHLGPTVISEALSGPCLQHLLLSFGVVALSHADGGPCYGLPQPLARQILLSYRPHTPTTSSRWLAPGGEGTLPRALMCMLDRLGSTAPPAAPLGPRAATTLALRTGQLAVTSAKAWADGAAQADGGAALAAAGQPSGTAASPASTPVERDSAEGGSVGAQARVAPAPRPGMRLPYTVAGTLALAALRAADELLAFTAVLAPREWLKDAAAERWRLAAETALHTLRLPGSHDFVGLAWRLQLGLGALDGLENGKLPPVPPPSVSAALRGGLVRCLEALVRRAGLSPGGAEAGLLARLFPSGAGTTGPYLACLLAYGDPREAAALVVSVGKLLRRIQPGQMGSGLGLGAAAVLEGRDPDAGMCSEEEFLGFAHAIPASLLADLAPRFLAAVAAAANAEPSPGSQRCDVGGSGDAGGGGGGGGTAAGPQRQLLLMLALAALRWLPPMSRQGVVACRLVSGLADMHGAFVGLVGAGTVCGAVEKGWPALCWAQMLASLDHESEVDAGVEQEGPRAMEQGGNGAGATAVSATALAAALAACGHAAAAGASPAPSGAVASVHPSWREALLGEGEDGADCVRLAGAAMRAVRHVRANDMRNNAAAGDLAAKLGGLVTACCAMVQADAPRILRARVAQRAATAAATAAVGAAAGAPYAGEQDPAYWIETDLEHVGCLLAASGDLSLQPHRDAAWELSEWVGDGCPIRLLGPQPGVALGPTAGQLCQGKVAAAARGLPSPAEASGLLRTCAHPGCTNLSGDSEAALKLQGCSGCGAVGYCCRACQTAHWRAGHKGACKRRGAGS